MYMNLYLSSTNSCAYLYADVLHRYLRVSTCTELLWDKHIIFVTILYYGMYWSR